MPSSPTTDFILGADASERPAQAQFVCDVNNTQLPSTALTARKRPSAGVLTTSTTAAGKRTARITTTAAVCPEAAGATTNAPLPRCPLRLRDQNAAPALRAVKQKPETKTSLMMAARIPPHDRVLASGQRQPTVARAVNKPPLTPKIAARPPASHQQNPTLATTPLARRPLAPESTLSASGTGPRDRDDLTSPASAFLNSNITPRSGSRQSRVDSAHSTPVGTPNPERQDHWETRSGLGTPDDGQNRPIVTLTSPSEVGKGPKSDRDSKFFYASDAQKQPQQPALARQSATQHQKPTFFYANGNTVPERQRAPSPGPLSPPLASPSSQDNLASKFVYANGTPKLQPAPKIGPSSQSRPSSAVSIAPRLPTTRQGHAPRPTSPAKPAPPLASKNSSGTPMLSPRSPVSSTTNLQNNSQANHGRGINPDFHTLPKPHARAQSVVSVAEPPVVTKRVSSHGSLPSSGSASPAHTSQPGSAIPPSSPAGVGFASLLQAAEDFAEADENKPDSLNSPAKTSQDGQPTELVANARRERKVQDLEITNASLEAINRTLERQLRKQTAELRRYQRLSRSGRLSLSSIGSRIPSESTVDGEGLARAATGLDDLSEEGSENAAEDAELDELERDDDMSSSEASEDLDPEATAAHDMKRRRRDEKRLQLDLSKHRQLLVDSQKINQSIKRCLGWTEELIKEGKRALAYQVRVSDVSLGGRVLAPEEVERREAGEDGAGDDEYQEDTLYGLDLKLDDGPSDAGESGSPWGKDPQDRDSGIELAADGS
ncbi:hypothetical protein VTK26DRAFT_4991 [Humicola hyalothermophila]